jgi:hypothetical protein
VLSQFGDDLPFVNRDNLEHTWEWVAHFALALVVVVALLVGLVLWVVISVTGYVLQWWNLLLEPTIFNLFEKLAHLFGAALDNDDLDDVLPFPPPRRRKKSKRRGR